MKIHLISDTHIESGIPDLPVVCGDVCVLAGDIGVARKVMQYVDFIHNLKDNFEHIIMVNGNHEFYHMEYDGALYTMKNMADEFDIHLLDVQYGTENLEIDGVKFWGSTLWTDLNRNDWFARRKVSDSLNDFHVVPGLTISKAYDLHLEMVEKINWDADVIITHHMPILREHSRFPISDITYGFSCTDLEDKIYESDVKYWLYGHTHDNRHFDIGGTQVISNQSGYRGENMLTAYDPRFMIEI